MNEIDLGALKQVQQQVWSNGDFARIGALGQMVAEILVDSAEVMPGERVLDVACGSGNAAIAAARRFTDVTGLDYVPELLAAARGRAEAEGFEIEWIEGDAEDLPFDDASFDVVLSTWGAMFAPDHEKTAAELLRVCRPGGRIAMNNWTPEGVTGQMFKAVSGGVPPPPGIRLPTEWGTEDRVRELFADGISELRTTKRLYTQRARSVDEWFDFFSTWFGPLKTAMDAADEAGKQRIETAVKELMRQNNTCGDRAMAVPSEYLEVVAVRAG